MPAIRGEAPGLRRASRRSCRYAASSGRLNQTCRMIRLSADDRNCPRPSHSNGARTIRPGVRHTRQGPEDQFIAALPIVAEVLEQGAYLLISHEPLVHLLDTFGDSDLVRVVVMDEASLRSLVDRRSGEDQQVLDVRTGLFLFCQFEISPFFWRELRRIAREIGKKHGSHQRHVFQKVAQLNNDRDANETRREFRDDCHAALLNRVFSLTWDEADAAARVLKSQADNRAGNSQQFGS